MANKLHSKCSCITKNLHIIWPYGHRANAAALLQKKSFIEKKNGLNLKIFHTKKTSFAKKIFKTSLLVFYFKIIANGGKYAACSRVICNMLFGRRNFIDIDVSTAESLEQLDFVDSLPICQCCVAATNRSIIDRLVCCTNRSIIDRSVYLRLGCLDPHIARDTEIKIC
jgi:hypothetical protein